MSYTSRLWWAPFRWHKGKNRRKNRRSNYLRSSILLPGRWCCYVRGVNNEDISYFVRKVVFTLHPTFVNNVRTVEQPPFEIQEQGWGEFDITVKIHFVDSSEKPVEIVHFLKLFNDDKSNQTPRKPIINEEYDEIVFSEPTVCHAPQIYRKIFIRPCRIHLRTGRLPASPSSSLKK